MDLKQKVVKLKPASLTDISRRGRRSETARLAILSRAASRLLVSDFPEQLVQSLAEQVMAELNCQFFFNFIPHPEKGCLRLNAYAGIPTATAEEILLLDYGVAVCGTVAQQGERIIKECIQSLDDPIVALVKSFGVRAYACHPLLSPKGCILGTLSFGTTARDGFQEDELALMQTLSNQIAAAFQRIQVERELRKLNVELEERIVKRTYELEVINAELKSYVYTIAHDFRAPLVNLKGFSGELEKTLSELKDALSDTAAHLPVILRSRIDELLSREIPESFSFISVSGDKLDKMVSALLKLSQLGMQECCSREIDMNILIQTLLAAYERNIQDKGIRVEIAPLPVINANPTVIERTFDSLIDNAIKYMEAHRPGEIRIAGAVTNSEYIFHVQDNGRGIAIEEMDKIFDIFRRAGKQDVPGEGVGLAYVRAMLRQLGGRIWCQSQLGVGTTMNVAIPILRPLSI